MHTSSAPNRVGHLSKARDVATATGGPSIKSSASPVAIVLSGQLGSIGTPIEPSHPVLTYFVVSPNPKG